MRTEEPAVTEEDLSVGIRLLLYSKGKMGVAALGLKKLQKFASPDQAQELQDLYDVIVSEKGDMDRELYEEAILVHTLCLIAFHLCAIVLRVDSPRNYLFLGCVGAPEGQGTETLSTRSCGPSTVTIFKLILSYVVHNLLRPVHWWPWNLLTNLKGYSTVMFPALLLI